MDDQDVGRHWDANAPDWTRAVRAGWDVYREHVNNPAFLAMLPCVAGLRVLDLGCGEGYNTRKLADLGARLVGIDVSAAMVAAAQEQEAAEPRGIEYHATSASDLSLLDTASFDAVLSTMVMMDLADYGGAVREVARVLKPGGLFQFSITHPCTMARRWRWVRDSQGKREGMMVGNYFGLEPTPPEKQIDEWFYGAAPAPEKAKARRFRVPRFFRTLSEYFNTLVDAGFCVTRLTEPYADDAAVQHCADVADTRIVPYFLVLQCRRD